MTTATIKGQEKITALYCRLSVEDMKSTDEKGNDSNSIKNQKQILQDGQMLTATTTLNSLWMKG